MPASDLIVSKLRDELQQLPDNAQVLVNSMAQIIIPERLADLVRGVRADYATVLEKLASAAADHCQERSSDPHYAEIIPAALELAFIADIANRRLEATDRRSLLQPWHTLRHA